MPPRPTNRLLIALVAIIALTWIVGMPRSVGPDEPSHRVRAGALVRGDLDGVPLVSEGSRRGFELPGWVGFPDPGCFAFQPEQPTSCTSEQVETGDTVVLGTKADEYQIWGHVPAGVGTYLPGVASSLGARVGDAIVPLILLAVGLTLAARRGAVAQGAALLAMTPMVWFLLGVVNPSGLAIAGGFAMWSALVDGPPERTDRLARWAIAGGWAALTLSRRDGMIWAALIVSIVVVLGGVGLPDLARRLGRAPLVLVGAATAATMVWAVFSDSWSSRVLLVVPLVPVAAEAVRRSWAGAVGPPARALVVAVAAAGALIVSAGVAVARPGGFDAGVLGRAVGFTGQDLREAIGVLGWLDTPVPPTARFVWLLGLGTLVGFVVAGGRWRALAVAAATLGTGLWASWMLTTFQSDPSGAYWQGRYYLPLLVGIPIVLAAGATVDRGRTVVAGRSLAAVGLLVQSAALYAAMRRFAAGASGSVNPFVWSGTDVVVPMWIVLGVNVAVAAAAVLVVGAPAVTPGDPSAGRDLAADGHDLRSMDTR